MSALSEHTGLEQVDLINYPIDTASARLVSPAMARRYKAIPIGWEQGSLLVAVSDPSNVLVVDDFRTVTGASIRLVVAAPSAVLAAIATCYRSDAEAERASAEAASSFDASPQELAAVREVVEDGPIVKLVNLLIGQAVTDRASDIHIEPGARDLRIRFRIDGVLHEIMRPPSSIANGVISRVKIMASLNIAERRVPQDGRITTRINGLPVDLRVATLPTIWGEKVVMRILDKSTAMLKLSDLGFLPENMTRYESSYRKPYGTILVTGPTGSGKSTTLYATLNILNDVSKNVITVEDPVEYQLEGINQVQVNPKAGLGFASALRSILRSDPDIVLLGEIRDRETAQIAIEAALTGHLVLSTLHTNDAASSPGRLIEMGVEPFLVGSALDCIVAQRLARRLCEKCKQAYTVTPEELSLVGWDPERMGHVGETREVFRPVGCGACGRTGYRGRFAVHEVLTVNEETERTITERGHSEDVLKVALADGMLTLRQAGLIEVLAGRTSIEEVLRVIA
ncbi:MAG: GspE/PulE family protein [Actinomycetota bacterium]|nr:GspE/PulE family protein [Actinomycetota bacterium]